MAIKFTEAQVKEINKLIRDTDLNQSEIAEAVNTKFPKATPVEGHNVTHYAKRYFGVKMQTGKKSILTPAYKRRFTFKARKGVLIDAILDSDTLKVFLDQHPELMNKYFIEQ